MLHLQQGRVDVRRAGEPAKPLDARGEDAPRDGAQRARALLLATGGVEALQALALLFEVVRDRSAGADVVEAAELHRDVHDLPLAHRVTAEVALDRERLG